MYENSFGLEKNPFGMTPDPAFLFLTAQHREAISGLAYAILSRKGFAVLTGEAGTGKTTVVSKVLHCLPERVRFSLIINPTVTPSEFVEMAMLDFQIPEVPASKAQRIFKLQQFLLDNRATGHRSALVVDEAHKLSKEVLEEIRLLGNFERHDEKLLQILLIGQPELDDVLNREDLRQFKQRVALRFSIEPLSAGEMEKYIAHRWAKAGGKSPQPFCEAAIAQIAILSRGIPRIVNAVCDNALVVGFCQNSRKITAEHVHEAAQDLRLLDGSAGKLATQAVNRRPPTDQTTPVNLPIEAPAFRTLERQRIAESRPSLLARWTAKLGFTN
jgi:general secretion pathway protein A